MIDIINKHILNLINAIIVEQVKIVPVFWSNFDLFFYCRSPPRDSLI